jgi:glycosyltransferase involved in cell wall biosynthesis
MSEQLTLLIPCKNERSTIGPCIASVQGLADELLVADSGSTDGTVEFARSLGARVIEREYRWSGDFKNWAIPQAKNSWVLLLDADERASPELMDEIRKVLAAPRYDGYWIRRLNHLFGHPVRWGSWKNDKVLRLFRRDQCRYVGSTDHAEIKISTGKIGSLQNRLIHYTCRSYEQYLPKVCRYASVQAELWHRKGYRAHYHNLLARGPLRFLQSYVFKLGFLDGAAGLQCASLVAYQSYLKQARLWQLQNEIAEDAAAATDGAKDVAA